MGLSVRAGVAEGGQEGHQVTVVDHAVAVEIIGADAAAAPFAGDDGYRRRERGFRTVSTGWYPRTLAVLDFNEDARLDIVTADSGTNTLSSFASVAGGPSSIQYQPPVQLPTPPRPVNVEPGGNNPKEINDVAVARSTPPCRGDLDGDARVGANDLTLLLGVFGGPASQSEMARRSDLNADGAVDTRDLVRLLARFGNVCG